jgi:serine/threonine-protein kinase
MGAVHRVFDELLGEDVALKVLRQVDAAHIARFKREIVLARKVTHKNVARTYDIGLDGGAPFITMELVLGESLRARMDRGPVGAPEIAAIVGQMAAGLAAAHEASVIHRDLKPANVILGADGRVVIVDFGVAAALDPEARETDELVGTFDYMAPEQIRGAAPRPSVDVYALGLIGFELVAGALPFRGSTPEERALARLHEVPPKLSSSSVPRATCELFERCLSIDPEMRPAAREVAALLAAAAPVTLAPSPLAATTGARPRRPRTVRVLPFASGGHGEELGRGLADEVADLLSRTRGVDVVTGVDPSYEGHAAVDLLVQGTVKEEGGAVAITARLIDDRTGDPIWSGRFEGELGELLRLSSRLAGQVTEALRLELELLDASEIVPPEAVAHYLRARGILRSPSRRMAEAIEALDRCLALAPDLPAAVAARAVAVARAHFFGDRRAGDLSDEAPRAAARAALLAPDLPDSLLARGLVALHQRRFDAGAEGLRRAVAAAPTNVVALEQLGRLEVESGRFFAGIEHLELAVRLDPRRRTSLLPIARSHALRGDLGAFGDVMRALVTPEPLFEAAVLRARVAAWFEDAATARAAHRELLAFETTHVYPLAPLRAALVAGDPVDAELRATTESVLQGKLSSRMATVLHQTTCEVYARRDPDYAASHLGRAAALSLVDVEWLLLCPALDPLRDSPAFEDARRTVLTRARSMWSTTG